MTDRAIQNEQRAQDDRRRDAAVKADRAMTDHHRRIEDRRHSASQEIETRRLLAQSAEINARSEVPNLDAKMAAAERRRNILELLRERRRRFLRALRARRGRGSVFTRPPRLRDMLTVIGTAIAVAVSTLMTALRAGMQRARAYVPRIEPSFSSVPRRQVLVQYPNPPVHPPRPKPKKAVRPDPPSPVRAAMPAGTVQRQSPEEIERERQRQWSPKTAMENAAAIYGDKHALTAVAECLAGRSPKPFHFEVLKRIDEDGDLLDFFRGRHDMADLRTAWTSFGEQTRQPGIDDRYVAERMLPRLLKDAKAYGNLLRAKEAAEVNQNASLEPGEATAPTPEPEQKKTLDPWTQKPS